MFSDHKSGVRPADVVVLAHDAIKRYGDAVGGHIERPIKVIDGLVPVVEKLLNITVSIHCLPYPGKFVKGRLQRYKDKDDKARIYYSKECNTCWSRFVICKEIMHLLCGDENNFTNDAERLINGMLAGMPPGISEEIDIEQLAVYGAIELLIPVQFYDELAKMKDGGRRYYDIADDFKIPQKVLELRMKPAMREFFDKTRDIITDL